MGLLMLTQKQKEAKRLYRIKNRAKERILRKQNNALLPKTASKAMTPKTATTGSRTPVTSYQRTGIRKVKTF